MSARNAIWLVAVMGGLLVTYSSVAQKPFVQVDIAAMQLGLEPSNFAFGRTGSGAPAEWRVVSDPTAVHQAAIAQTSTDTTDYRFPLAVYKPVSAKDVDVSIRVKPIGGKVDQADGIQSSAALAAASLVSAPALAQTPPATGPKPMSYAIKPLPFDPKSIKGLSEKILTSHYENNYSGAVKRLNAITEQLAGLDYAKAPVFVVNGLKREELIAANSMILHEIYFGGLGEQSEPGGALADALARDFGSLDRWRTEFVAMGKAEGGGSGWVILAWSPRDRRLINCWSADHTTNLAGGQPILVLDMYEHAYHMDYGAKAGDYVEAYMKAIRWANADELYMRYSRAA